MGRLLALLHIDGAENAVQMLITHPVFRIETLAILFLQDLEDKPENCG